MVVPPRRIGLELEFSVVETATGRGLERGGAQRLWRSLAAHDTSWSLVEETVTGVVTGVRRRTADFDECLNTDTGVCTVEVSLAPRETVGQAVDAAGGVLRTLQGLLDAVGYTLLCAGIQPRTLGRPRPQFPEGLVLAPVAPVAFSPLVRPHRLPPGIDRRHPR